MKIPPLQSAQKWLLALVLAALAPAQLMSPAHAAGGVTCASTDGRAEIGISMGRLPIYAPTAASARLDSKRWSGVPQDGETELGESQGLLERDKLSVDFVGADISKIIISLRVDHSGEEQEHGFPGTLTFEDGISRQVFCQFE